MHLLYIVNKETKKIAAIFNMGPSKIHTLSLAVQNLKRPNDRKKMLKKN